MSDKIRNIIIRYGIIYFVVLLLFALVAAQIVKIQFSEKNAVLEMNERYKPKSYSIAGNRGKILASDGSILATSLPQYILAMDMRTPALRPDTATLPKPNDNAEILRKKQAKAKNQRQKNQYDLFDKYIDSTAVHLSQIFGDKSAEQYKKDLTQAFNEKNRYFKLYPKRINNQQYLDVRKDSLLAMSSVKNGLIAQKFTMRVKPFGPLASRTVGSLDELKGTQTGFEKYFNRELRGDSGRAVIERIGNEKYERILVEPKDGMDIQTTIDTRLQDMAQAMLTDGVTKNNAPEGCAILMTTDGEIKAVVNLFKDENGNYSEAKDMAMQGRYEIGSTFKTVAMMIAVDKGFVRASDTVNTRTSKYSVSDLHSYSRNLTANQVIAYSNNIGISNIITNSYENNPQQFIDEIYARHILDTMKIQIPNVVNPMVNRERKNSKQVQNSTIARISYGHSISVPPVYMLRFYNTLANNGEMVEPRLATSISSGGKIVKTFDKKVINPAICSPQTLQTIRQMLENVINDEHGTGHRIVKSNFVKIAGKTGTADIKHNGKDMNYASFAGYFPADKPQYTCIVAMVVPPQTYGAGASGAVFKNIAEQTMALMAKKPVVADKADSASVKFLKSKPGTAKDLNVIAQRLNLNIDSIKPAEKQMPATVTDSLGNSFTAMPDCTGWGAKNVIFALKKLGLEVEIAGRGKVVVQNIQAGKAVKRGERVRLVLQ